MRPNLSVDENNVLTCLLYCFLLGTEAVGSKMSCAPAAWSKVNSDCFHPRMQCISHSKTTHSEYWVDKITHYGLWLAHHGSAITHALSTWVVHGVDSPNGLYKITPYGLWLTHDGSAITHVLSTWIVHGLTHPMGCTKLPIWVIVWCTASKKQLP